MIGTDELLIRLALGAVFGGAIGYERQTHGRPAGFRTHILVCVASVLIMEVSEYYHYLGLQDPSYVRVDPGRIAAGAITGVGFLGAGVIVKMGATVQGLTTAACLWMVSAIGLAIGSGLYAAGASSFAVTLVALTTLRAVEARTARVVFKSLSLAADEGLDENEVFAALQRHRATVHGIDYEMDAVQKELLCRYTVALSDKAPLREILEEVSKIGGVKKASLKS